MNKEIKILIAISDGVTITKIPKSNKQTNKQTKNKLIYKFSYCV